MIKLSTQSVIHTLPCKLTLGFLALTLFSLSVSAQDTVVRSGGTISGKDVATVQTADGAANGDTLTISGSATHNSTVNLTSAYNTFTICSNDPDVKQTISGTANPFYSMNEEGDYTINLNNVGYTGNSRSISFIKQANSVTGNIAINADNASFTGFKSRAIVCTDGSISGANNKSVISFSNNSVGGQNGGAIYGTNLEISNGNFIFQNNSSGSNEQGGAIYCSDSLTFSGDTTATFTGNYGSFGSAIYATNVNFTSGTYIFQNNRGSNDGAICSPGTVTFSGVNTTATFTGNSANYGAAIYANKLEITNGTYTFQNNYSGFGGGVILCDSLNFSNVSATFTGNTCLVLWGTGNSQGQYKISNGTYIFENNNSRAIQFYGTFTFSGDNTTAKFTGNTGNDIYCINDSVLNFIDSGTYYFDGGINLNMHANQSRVSINQAQVTIAGRQYKPNDPTVEDTTNNYELKRVNISNGGKLTADLDYINKIIGKFTFSGSESLFTQNKGSDPATKKTATIKSSSGSGVMDLTYEAQGGVSSESVFISSGRIDIKGCMEASVTLQSGAKFSPGNSAGKLEITGDFVATAGSMLVFEQEGSAYDQLIANNVTINSGANFDLSLFTNFAHGSYYDIIIANGTLDVDPSWIEGIQNFLSAYDATALIYNSNTVRLKSVFDPVPEPSTWALLVLGVAGLMYLRKRK